jgi:pilus assembly protein CpaE
MGEFMYPLKVILVGCSEGTLLDVHRELVNHAATVEAEFPDVKSVIGELPLTQTEKRLFIVEVRSPEHLSHLERLNDTYIGRPILALVNVSDPQVLVAAVRSGAAQVLALPIRTDEFRASMDRIARQFGYRPSECKVIAVSGVSEGCGVTTLAINLAHEIAYHQKVPTILTELGLQMGRLAISLNVKPRYTTHDLLTEMEHLDITSVRDALTPVADHFQVITGPYQTIQGRSISLPQVLRLIDYMRRLSNVVVLDMPYTYDDLYFGVLSAVDEIVLVAEPTVPSIHAMRMMLDKLGEKEHTATIHSVINRHHTHDLDFSSKKFQDLVNVPTLLTVRNDHGPISEALTAGQPLRVVAPHSKVLEDVDKLARRVLGLEKPPPLSAVRKHSWLHWFHHERKP